MTKKDFEFFASLIKTAKEMKNEDYTTMVIISEIQDKMTEYFANDNPRFDRDRFYEACKAV